MSKNSVIYKQIYFDEISGKLLILDDQNNNYECNIYGDKTTQFLPNVTGLSSYTDRMDKTGGNFNTKFDSTFYRPQTNRFEGYFQFPRPLSRPFFNKQIKERDHLKIVKIIEDDKRMTLNKNKNTLHLKSNQGIHYLTSNLSITDESSKKHLLKVIDNFIEDFKEKNKYKLDIIDREPKIKALRKLINLLHSNYGDKIINGRHLPRPNSNINNKNIIYSKLIRREIGENDNLKAMVNVTNSTLKKLTENKTEYKGFYDHKKINYTQDVKDDLSFLSIEDDTMELNYDNYEYNNVKRKISIEKRMNKEKRLLKGFQPIKIKEKGLIEKQVPKNIKTESQLYIENIKLLKRVNPIAFENEERKNKLYDLVLKKKMDSRLVNQKNLGY